MTTNDQRRARTIMVRRLLAAATLLVAVVGGPVTGFETSLPIVFAIYGTGLMTSGVMSNTKPLSYAGFGAFAMIAAALWFEGTSAIWAVASLGAFLTVLLPGLVLMRNEPQSVI